MSATNDPKPQDIRTVSMPDGRQYELRPNAEAVGEVNGWMARVRGQKTWQVRPSPAFALIRAYPGGSPSEPDLYEAAAAFGKAAREVEKEIRAETRTRRNHHRGRATG